MSGRWTASTPTEAAQSIDRRQFLVGAGLVGAGVALAGCGLFDDGGPDRISYGSAPSQFGELYEPDAPTPWPVIVAIHGGAWRDEESLSILGNVCGDLRGRGYAVWNIEYRRVGERGGGFPGTLEDVAAAIDHMDTVAEDHPIDLARLAVFGHSAGGTLALWAGGRAGLPGGAPGADPQVSPQAVISLSGVPDLARCAERNELEGACPQFLGGTPGDRPERYAVASPIELLPLGLPQVVLQGRADEVVPTSQTERYAAAAESAGDPTTLRFIEGANHFTVIEPDRPAWATVVEEIDRLAL